MDWNEIAPMIVFVTGILVSGGVILLRPLTRRLGDLLEVMAQQKQGLRGEHELHQLRELVASMESRISLLEERQSFTESLLQSGPHRAALPGAARPASSGHPAPGPTADA